MKTKEVKEFLERSSNYTVIEYINKLEKIIKEIKKYANKIDSLFWVEDDIPRYVSKDLNYIIKNGGNK